MNKIFLTLSLLLCSVSQLLAQNIVDTTLPGLIPYRKESLWGYCDENKSIKISPQFFDVQPFVGEFATVRIDSITEGIIDKSGKVIVTVGKDTTVWVSASGTIYVRHYDRDIIIKLKELDGDWISSGKYILHNRFSKGIYIAREGKRFGLIDKSGNIVLPFNYKAISSPDRKGFVRVVKQNGKTIFLDTSLKKFLLKLPAKYEVGDFSSDLATIRLARKKNSLTGFVNQSGKIVIPMIYKKAYSFQNDLSEVTDGSRTGFINSKGDTVISFYYGTPMHYSNGYISYELAYNSLIFDKYGNVAFNALLFDKNGEEKLRVKAKYDELRYVNDSIIIVGKKMPGALGQLKYGIINITGKEIWPCISYAIYGNMDEPLIYVAETWNKRYYMDYKFNKYYED